MKMINNDNKIFDVNFLIIGEDDVGKSTFIKKLIFLKNDIDKMSVNYNYNELNSNRYQISNYKYNRHVLFDGKIYSINITGISTSNNVKNNSSNPYSSKQFFKNLGIDINKYNVIIYMLLASNNIQTVEIDLLSKISGCPYILGHLSDSFDNYKDNDKIMIVLGNKCDKVNQSNYKYNYEHAKFVGFEYFEISSKYDYMIEDIFNYIMIRLNIIINKNDSFKSNDKVIVTKFEKYSFFNYTSYCIIQ